MKAVRSIFFLLLLGLCSLPCAASQKIQSLCQFHYPSDYLHEWDCPRLTAKDTPYGVFGKQWQDGLRFNRMDRRHFLAGVSIKVPRRIQEIKEFTPMPPTYPDGWSSYWLHGRDLPGYPASHGCIGLYDEEMQKKYYHEPGRPVLMDAKKLYQWALAGYPDTGNFQNLRSGPKVQIMGTPPEWSGEVPGGAVSAAGAPLQRR